MGLDRLIPFALEADTVTLIATASSFLRSLLQTSGVKRRIDIDKVNRFISNRLQNSKVISEIDSVCLNFIVLLDHRERLTVMGPNVVHNEQAHRYELWLDEKRIGLAEYSSMPGERHFVNTEVDPSFQNKGYAADLMREALADVRANSKDKVVPVCSYVVMYMKRHPETHDLLKGSIEEAVAACRWPGV
ncbi:unannotated protein [freshwater metagenome]|uniref:Unannotated protein n=1 Tax=freshwater metagenome TaxID=449393 RepID=A0A6J6JAI1_9ZZZZ